MAKKLLKTISDADEQGKKRRKNLKKPWTIYQKQWRFK